MLNPKYETESLKLIPNLTVSTKIVEAQNITKPIPIPKSSVRIVVVTNSLGLNLLLFSIKLFL